MSTLLNKPTIKRLLPILVILLGAGLSFGLMKSRPKPQSRPAVVYTPKVDVQSVSLGTHKPSWIAGGQVRAAEHIQLMAEVDGVVIDINPIATPGALLEPGQWLAQLKQDSYKFALIQQQSAVIQAESELALEHGRQQLAQEELVLADEKLTISNQALVLREPQIAAAKAELNKARAHLQQAQLDLINTRITMPFRGKIIERTIGHRSRISSTTPLFELINVDRFWLEVKVPRHFIQWLDTQALATLHQPSIWGNQSRQARILQIRPDVDSSDRQAKVVLEIEDPLALENTNLPKLFVNDFVEVTLPGKALTNSANVATKALLNNNQVWVVNEKKQLELRELSVSFRGRDHIIVQQSLAHGEQIVTSRLPSANAGMAVEISKTTQEHLQPYSQPLTQSQSRSQPMTQVTTRK